MIKKIKGGILTAVTVLIMGCSGITAMAAEADVTTDNIPEENVLEESVIADEADSVDATDTTVGVHDGKIMINEKNFPDEVFREYLSDEYDEDGDGIIEVADVGSISIWGYTHTGYPYKNIKSVEGIEYFSELFALNLTRTGIESIDVSNNLNLRDVMIRQNDNLTGTIDLTNNPLTVLSISNPENYKVIIPDISTWFSIEIDELEGVIDFNNIIGLDYSIITDSNFDLETKQYTYSVDDIGDNGRIYIETKEDVAMNMFLDCQYSNMVVYNTHVQSYGWQGYVRDGVMSGTSGEAKRLEAITIQLKGFGDTTDLGIQYTTHCQTYGWLPWSADGDENGTTGEGKRLEAIKIQLTGEDADIFDVYYRVHAQSYGWLGWAKNGEPAGTAGYGKRLEGIQIVIIYKSNTELIPGVTYQGVTGSATNLAYYAKDNSTPTVSGADTINVKYRTHVQTYGWQGYKYNGAMSGTSGQAKRLEGIEIDLTNQQYSGDIVYTTHVQSYGWQGDVNDSSTWKKNGEMSGTSGEAKRLEAICIDLTDEMAENYDIYYRVHAQTYGWLGWAKNGDPAGTAGYAKRLEGIQIVLVPKGGAAPTNYHGIESTNSSAYISK